MISSSKKWLGLGAVAALLTVGAIYMGAWSLFEANGVRRGSLSYLLGLPASIKRVPIIQECAAPTYRWRGRDGESPPFIEVSYSTRAAANEIVKAYGTGLIPAHCRLVRTDREGARTVSQFECGGDEFLSASVIVAEGTPCASVELGFIENY
jgi:hypothetical protein